MSDRIKDDPSLAEHVTGPIQIHRPVIIIDRDDEGRCIYRIHVSEVDPQTDDPRVFGIILSDLLDQLARAYRDLTGRDTRDIHAHILKVMRDEDRFKEKDPARGNLRGVTIMPRPQ